MNKELQTEIASVKRDRDECVKLLQSNSMSPLFYASTQVQQLIGILFQSKEKRWVLESYSRKYCFSKRTKQIWKWIFKQIVSTSDKLIIKND